MTDPLGALLQPVDLPLLVVLMLYSYTPERFMRAVRGVQRLRKKSD